MTHTGLLVTWRGAVGNEILGPREKHRWLDHVKHGVDVGNSDADNPSKNADLTHEPTTPADWQIALPPHVKVNHNGKNHPKDSACDTSDHRDDQRELQT